MIVFLTRGLCFLDLEDPLRKHSSEGLRGLWLPDQPIPELSRNFNPVGATEKLGEQAE